MSFYTSPAHSAAKDYIGDLPESHEYYHAFVAGARWLLTMAEELKEESQEKKEEVVRIAYLEDQFT